MLFYLADRRWHVSQTCVCARVFRSLCVWCVCITTYVVGSLVLIKMWQWRLFTANARVKIWRLRSNSIGRKNINQRTTRHNNRFSQTRDKPSYLGRGVFQKKTHLLRRNRFVHTRLKSIFSINEACAEGGWNKNLCQKKIRNYKHAYTRNPSFWYSKQSKKFSQLTNILLGKGWQKHNCRETSAQEVWKYEVNLLLPSPLLAPSPPPLHFPPLARRPDVGHEHTHTDTS